MAWQEFKKDWLDWEAYQSMGRDLVGLFTGDWTQQGMINASIFAAVLSMILAMVVVAKRSRGPSWLLLIITPILFLFSAAVVQAEYQEERFVALVALVVTGQWLFVSFAKHEWP